MPNIPTSFKDDELESIKKAAEKQGMTVDEFVSHATNRAIEKSQKETRKHFHNPVALKILK